VLPPEQRTGDAQFMPPVLQGRGQGFALIYRLIDEIDRAGSAIVISGEPGIGKSALLEVARHRASNRGLTVLTMTGVLAEVHLPFSALELALRPLMQQTAALVPRQRSALLAAFGIHECPSVPDIFLVALSDADSTNRMRSQQACAACC
jgi:hypothetical protein